jgi:hypothetical protein
MKKTLKQTIVFSLIVFIFLACANKNKTLEVNYLKEGVIHKDTIPLDFIDENGKISTPYIDTVRFCILDSISYPDMNSDNMTPHTTTVQLNFSKSIKPYSPEYYSAYTTYNIIKAIEYYNEIFDNKIDFDFEREYRTIDVCFGDFPGITHPNFYIFEKNSNPSPSLFFHEIGHRAFWYIQDEGGLGIKFRGLSIIHMGLLEYFTVSLNNSPIVGEDCLPDKLIRNASLLYKYPLDDSLKLRRTLELIEESYPIEMQNPQSNVSKNIKASYATYDSDVLDNVYENHRGGMVLTSTLWRIRQKIGQKKTDKLVAQTILELNNYMGNRSAFYKRDNNTTPLPNEIEWYDVFYGLIQKDNEFNQGSNISIIVHEFERTGYPIHDIAF